MRFHVIQTNPIWEQPIPNRAEIERALQQCSPQEADFVVLPELCETGFTMRSDLAATADSVQWGSRVAKSHKIWLQCGLARRQPDGGIANTATIFRLTVRKLANIENVFFLHLVAKTVPTPLALAQLSLIVAG